MSSATLFVWAWRGPQETLHPSVGQGRVRALAGDRNAGVLHGVWGLDRGAALGSGPAVAPGLARSATPLLLSLPVHPPPCQAGPGLRLRACVRASVCVCVAVPCPAKRHLSGLRAQGLPGRGAHEWWDDPPGPGSGNALQLYQPPQTPPSRPQKRRRSTASPAGRAGRGLRESWHFLPFLFLLFLFIFRF